MKIALLVSNRTTFPQELVRCAIEEVSAAIRKSGMEAVVPPMAAVADLNTAYAYAKYLKENPCDGVIAVFPNFGDESSCFTALRDAGVPILFQAYPDTLDKMGPATRRDAFCGKISAVNLFRQCNIPCTVFAPHTVAPDSENFARNLRDFAAVCRVANGMRRVRAGMLGARCTPFKTVRFDEVTLEKYGITCETFDLSGLFADIRKMKETDKAVKAKADELKEYANWQKNSEEACIRIAKLAVAIDRIITEYHLDLITLRCWMELEEEFKISPCVILSLLNNKKIVANCEVDIVNAVAMRALSLASNEPAACLDWNNNYGDDENACVLFHCGSVAGSLMRQKGDIVDHPMFARALGCGNGLGCNQGRMKPGLFTCATGLTRDGKLSFYLDQGNFAEETPPADFFGVGGVAHFTHFQNKLLLLLQYGFPHHMSLCYGNYLDAVQEAFRSYLHYDIILP